MPAKRPIPVTGNDLMEVLTRPIAEVIQPKLQPLKYADLPLISLFPKPQMKTAESLLEELDELKNTKAAVESREEEIKAELEQLQRNAPLVGGEAIRGFRFGDLCFAATPSNGRRTLSPELLVQNGVDPDVIKASYKPGKTGGVRRNFKRLGEADDGGGGEWD